ncbi:MAG TPA: sodium/glutamate symporter [Pyrinomonadaceae bacterium]|nr:sodium/glutamate symporter [Pyrinomonadaceae bacterium]
MELSIAEGLRTIKFDLVYTLALGAVFLLVGYGLQRRTPALARTSIPAAAIGGLLFALLALALRTSGTLGVSINDTLRGPLQTVFFTTIGFGATATLLRAGGWRMVLFLLLATLAGVVQTIVGLALARGLGAPDALGIICGALTLTGGPSTGLAWAATFEELGVAGASAVIVASATFGIFVASIVGNPVATVLIRRFRLAPAKADAAEATTRSAPDEENFWAVGATFVPDAKDEADAAREAARGRGVGESEGESEGESKSELTAEVVLYNLLLVLAVVGLGALLSLGIARLGLTLPGYVGAMVVAAAVRNFDDRFAWLRISARAIELIGVVSLALFLIIALMGLELWKLAGLAVPMLVILSAQVVVTILYAVLVTFYLMGRDYEAAVTSSGHIGFGLGITPNAVANMEALAARYGPAPRSFLVVPIVGASFIDFTNLLIITAFVNLIS